MYPLGRVIGFSAVFMKAVLVKNDTGIVAFLNISYLC